MKCNDCKNDVNEAYCMKCHNKMVCWAVDKMNQSRWLEEIKKVIDKMIDEQKQFQGKKINWYDNIDYDEKEVKKK